MKPDFGATSADYARHRAGFPDSLFERLAAYGIGHARQSIVDLGTGTGTLARGFARRGCRVSGIDIFEAMLKAARGQHGARDGRVGGGGTPMPTVPKRWVWLALNPSYEETIAE